MSIRNIILSFAIIAPFVAVGLAFASILAAIALLFVSHMLLLYPTLRPTCKWFGPVITRFQTERNEVWLTIDDGPDTDTPALLELLASHDAKVTFFVIAEKAQAHPERIQAILAAGHTIENHTLSHPSGTFWCLPPAAIRHQIEAAHQILATLTGRPSRLFRAPAGMKNPFVHPTLTRNHLRLTAWSARGIDGIGASAEQVVRRIMRSVTPGSILLMHQGRAACGNHSSSLESMQLLLTTLTKNNFRCVIPPLEALY